MIQCNDADSIRGVVMRNGCVNAYCVFVFVVLSEYELGVVDEVAPAILRILVLVEELLEDDGVWS